MITDGSKESEELSFTGTHRRLSCWRHQYKTEGYKIQGQYFVQLLVVQYYN